MCSGPRTRAPHGRSRGTTCTTRKRKSPHGVNRAGLWSALFAGGSPCANRASPNADADLWRRLCHINRECATFIYAAMLCTHPTACAPTSARPAPARHHAGPACRGARTPGRAVAGPGDGPPLLVCRPSSRHSLDKRNNLIRKLITPLAARVSRRESQRHPPVFGGNTAQHLDRFIKALAVSVAIRRFWSSAAIPAHATSNSASRRASNSG